MRTLIRFYQLHREAFDTALSTVLLVGTVWFMVWAMLSIEVIES